MLSASMKTPETEPAGKCSTILKTWPREGTCLRPNSSRGGTKIQVFRLLCSLTLSWAGKVGTALLRWQLPGSVAGWVGPGGAAREGECHGNQPRDGQRANKVDSSGGGGTEPPSAPGPPRLELSEAGLANSSPPPPLST